MSRIGGLFARLFDRGAWELLGSNLLTLAVAVWQQWPLALLMTPYVLQSIVIGVFAWRRIRRVHDYRMGAIPIRINGRRMTREDWPPSRLAGFFAMHFGIFHLVYLAAVLGMGSVSGASGLDWLGALALTLPFALSQRAMHEQQLAADRTSMPGTGTLMLQPYLRVVPMHIGIIGGFLLVGIGGMAWGVLLFCGLKTVFDLASYLVDRLLLVAAQVDERAFADIPDPTAETLGAFRDAVQERAEALEREGDAGGQETRPR